MVVVGVMSDSHDSMDGVVKAMEVFREHGVRTIIHLGDIVSPFIVKKMVELSWSGLVVYAVYGNNDGDKMLLYKLFSKAGWSIDNGPRIVDVGGKKVLLMHGYSGIDFTVNIAYSIARNFEGIDAVFYGHTHRLDHSIVNNKLVVNPGEVYGGLYGKSTIAIADLEKLRVEFIEL